MALRPGLATGLPFSGDSGLCRASEKKSVATRVCTALTIVPT